MSVRTLDSILADFSLLDDWEDRYRYVIELGNELSPFPEEMKTAHSKVQGCVSQVWIVSTVEKDNSGDITALHFTGDSDALIVRGLIAIVFIIYSGKAPEQILEINAREILGHLGLQEHLTPQRSNGLFSMIERIRHDAQNALSGKCSTNL